MAQSVKAPPQPRLVIHTVVKESVAQYFLMKLLEVRGGPTFTVRPMDGGGFHVWMSQRTYNDMKRVLAEARDKGEWE